MGQFTSSEVWQSSALDLINEFGGRDAATGRPVATVENVTVTKEQTCFCTKAILKMIYISSRSVGNM